jgi:hypothetical protein
VITIGNLKKTLNIFLKFYAAMGRFLTAFIHDAFWGLPEEGMGDDRRRGY